MPNDQSTLTPAGAYQAYYGPAIFDPLATHVLSVRSPSASAQVLDVACGTGILTRRAAAPEHGAARVVGVDVNPAMIDVARQTAPSSGQVPVEFHVGDGTALELDDAAFDLAYCQQGLQFYPDRAAGARELRRVLRPDGTAVVAVWQGPERHPFFVQLADIEEPRLADLGADVDRDDALAPFSFGDPDVLRSTLLDAGFRHVDVVARTVQARFADADRFIERLEFAYAAVIPAFAEDPESFDRYLANIADDARDLVSTYRDGDEVVIPMHANIAVAS